MIYQIVHTTEYQYSTAAEACHNLLRLDPRTCPGQTCLEMTLLIAARARETALVRRLFRQPCA